jgi:hypothetical protein
VESQDQFSVWPKSLLPKIRKYACNGFVGVVCCASLHDHAQAGEEGYARLPETLSGASVCPAS